MRRLLVTTILIVSCLAGNALAADADASVTISLSIAKQYDVSIADQAVSITIDDPSFYDSGYYTFEYYDEDNYVKSNAQWQIELSAADWSTTPGLDASGWTLAFSESGSNWQPIGTGTPFTVGPYPPGVYSAWTWHFRLGNLSWENGTGTASTLITTTFQQL